MQSIHLDALTIRSRSWKRMLCHLQRFVLSCVCLENCRMCGKELSLAGDLDPSLQQKEQREINDRMSNFWSEVNALMDKDKHNTDKADSQGPVSAGQTATVDQRESYGRILKRHTTISAKRPPVHTFSDPKHSSSNSSLEGCTQDNPALAPETVQALDQLKNAMDHLADFALSVLSVEAVRPALLKTAGCRSYFPRFSECLCHDCWDALKIDLPLVAFCPLAEGRQTTLAVASGSAYEGKLKDLIGEFKYEGERLLAQDLACVMVNAWSALCEYVPQGKLLIVPVPLHWQRKQNRGFNQSELLAKELSAAVGAPTCNRAMKRIKSTKPQQKLGKTERLANVRDAFVGNPALLKGKTIVLVDDVCTSGATLVECADEALRCGAQSVAALTVARAVLFASAA
jgi:ComF family protein